VRQPADAGPNKGERPTSQIDLLEGRKPDMNDLIKLVMLAGALCGMYHSAKAAWQLGTELFG
jgi:hypothetical protein